MRKTVLIITLFIVSLSASAKYLNFDREIIGSRRGVSLAPRADGKGQRVVVDTTRWDFHTTKDNTKVLTDRKYGGKIIVEFNDKNMATSVADVSNTEIQYETKDKRVRCRFDKGYTQACSVHTTNACLNLNESFHKLFKGKVSKLNECAEKLHNVSLATYHKSNKLWAIEKQQILR